MYRTSTYFRICSCDLHLTFASDYSVPSCRHLLWRGLSVAHHCNESQDDTTANGRTALCSMLMVVKEQDVFVATHTNSGFLFLQYLGYLDLHQLSIHSAQRRKQVYSLNEAGEGQSLCQSVFLLGLIYFQHTPTYLYFSFNFSSPFPLPPSSPLSPTGHPAVWNDISSECISLISSLTTKLGGKTPQEDEKAGLTLTPPSTYNFSQ